MQGYVVTWWRPGQWAETRSQITNYKVLCVDCIHYFYVFTKYLTEILE